MGIFANHQTQDFFAERLSVSRAIEIFKQMELAELLGLAHQARYQKHQHRTYYVHSLNLNPTNICENRCALCAFWREPQAGDAYQLSLEEARARLEAAKDWKLTDLHIVGGITPALNLEYYEQLIRLAKQILPTVLVQGLTAVEIHYLAQQAGINLAQVLERLKQAGLGAIPGGGAEIFNSHIRHQICANKISAEEWLAVHEQAHRLGLPSNATLLFGHIESAEDIVDHLARLRELQDRTGGFQAIIALPFHPDGTKLQVSGPSGHLVARVVALARLFLDNFSHVRLLANYVDRKLMQVLTYGGVDDIGGTSLDERIARAAGASITQLFPCFEEMESFIRELDLEPILVNSAYQPVSVSPLTNSSSTTLSGFQSSPAISCRIQQILDRAAAGERLPADDAILLLEEAPLAPLGLIAHQRRMQRCPEKIISFVMDRNISTSNECEAGCKFCAFHVPPGDPKAFTLSSAEIVAKVIEAAEHGATQVMLQGGLNPRLNLDFYELVFRQIKQHTPDICLHSLSPTEILYLSRRSGLTIHQCLERLRAAGLDSLPGGGAEILVEEIRQQVSPLKITATEWLEVMEIAQRMGMKTTATMVYGLGETLKQRVEHLLCIRDLQDRTGGFTAFIPWSFQPHRTRISRPLATAVEYLKLIAVARLVLDNVPHIQAGWVTEGPDVAQLVLSFGADDFGGVLMEEQVVRATGVNYTVTAKQVIALIKQMGMVPAQRTTQYQILHRYS